MLIVLSLLAEGPFIKKVKHTIWFYSFIVTCLANLVSMTHWNDWFGVFWNRYFWVIRQFSGEMFSLGRQYIAEFSLAGLNTIFELGSLVFL